MIIKTLLLLALSVSAETEVGSGSCFNLCMGNPRNSFAKCRADCARPQVPATEIVGNGGCSCVIRGKKQNYCRTGSKSFKLSKDDCARKAKELGAQGFEFGGTDNCMTHTAAPTGGNNYAGVTCYKFPIVPVVKAGNGGCSCKVGGKTENYCRTGSQKFKLSKDQCEKKARDIGAAGFETGGTDNCVTHTAVPTGGNNYRGVTCYKFGTALETEVGGCSSSNWCSTRCIREKSTDANGPYGCDCSACSSEETRVGGGVAARRASNYKKKRAPRKKQTEEAVGEAAETKVAGSCAGLDCAACLAVPDYGCSFVTNPMGSMCWSAGSEPMDATAFAFTTADCPGGGLSMEMPEKSTTGCGGLNCAACLAVPDYGCSFVTNPMGSKCWPAGKEPMDATAFAFTTADCPGAETEVGSCFNTCMGNPRNSFSKCRTDCAGQLTKPGPKPGAAVPPTEIVGNGGCSCDIRGKKQNYCRTGSKSFKLSKDDCARKAKELGAKGFEFGGTDNCMTHAAAPTGGNNYAGVTCYKFATVPVVKAGNGGCSCKVGRKTEHYCRTGSQKFKLSKDQCEKMARDLGAAGFEFGGTDNCVTHTAVPTGGNNYAGVTCYKFGTDTANTVVVAEEASHVSLVIQALAVVGFLTTAYGAVRHYVK